MSKVLNLSATNRTETGKGFARLARRNNLVPGIIYGAGSEPNPINVKFNELLKLLKAGKFMSTLIDLEINGKSEKVICRDIQRNIVNDLPTHIDFMRLAESASINLFIPVKFENQNICPGLRRGGVLTVVRNEVELIVNASNIPSELIVDLSDKELGDTIYISNIKLPEGTKPTITGRNFVIANIQAPSGLKSSDNEEANTEDTSSEEEVSKEEE